MSICSGLSPPPIVIIRKLYSNLCVHVVATSGHFLTAWIRGFEYQITRKVVSDALSVPIVRNPNYSFIDPPSLDDVVSLFCWTPMTWDDEPKLDSNELTKENCIFYRIACHSILPLTHMHTVATIGYCSFLPLSLVLLFVSLIFLFKPLLIFTEIPLENKISSSSV